MRNEITFSTVVGMILIMVILVGEFGMYSDVFDYDVEMDYEGNYTISDNASHQFHGVLSDNGTFSAPTELYIYYDDHYGSAVRGALVEIGAKPLDQSYYISQLINNLNYYQYTNIRIIDALELDSIVADTANAISVGIVMLSGAIPDIVYSETNNDLLDWLSAGGTLYWVGNLLGSMISYDDGTVSEYDGDDYQEKFFGTTCLNPKTDNPSGREIQVFDTITENDYRKMLCLKNNNSMFAVDTTVLEEGTYLGVGFTDGQYASIAFVKHGEGQICIAAGDYSNNQRMDLATVIAAGLCYSSQIVDEAQGSVSHSSVTGKLNIPDTHGSLEAFFFLGGDFSVYGERFHIEE